MTSVSDENQLETRDDGLAAQIMAAVRSVRHGNVVITIHESEVVQIDKTEKLRVRKARDCICPVADPKTGGKANVRKI